MFNKSASFIKLYESNEANMGQILEQLQLQTASVQGIQRKTKKWIKTAALLAAVGALFVLITFSATEGLSLILYEAVVICGIFALLFFILKQKGLELRHVREMTRLTEEFRLIVQQLKNSLEGVKSSCENLRKTLVGDEAVKYSRLEINILELFCTTEKLKTITVLNCDLHQTEVVDRISQGFRRLNFDLQTFHT